LTNPRIPVAAGGRAFQILFSAAWSCPKTPEGPTRSRKIPTTDISTPSAGLRAPASMSCTTKAAPGPMYWLNSPSNAPRTASSPKNAPAIATATSNSGASKNADS
jgi:hypothetical protein